MQRLNPGTQYLCVGLCLLFLLIHADYKSCKCVDKLGVAESVEMVASKLIRWGIILGTKSDKLFLKLGDTQNCQCLYVSTMLQCSFLSHKHKFFQTWPSTGVYSSDNLVIASLKDLKYYIDKTWWNETQLETKTYRSCTYWDSDAFPWSACVWHRLVNIRFDLVSTLWQWISHSY